MKHYLRPLSLQNRLILKRPVFQRGPPHFRGNEQAEEVEWEAAEGQEVASEDKLPARRELGAAVTGVLDSTVYLDTILVAGASS